MPKRKNNPRRVILHCSDTPDYKEGDKLLDIFTAKDIDAWHREKGWKKIGYHYVITRGGVLEKGRAVEEYGAHVKGHNKDTLGVCYIGAESPTAAQVEALISLYQYLFIEYGIPHNKWFGHRYYNKGKTCPGFSTTILQKLLWFASPEKRSIGTTIH